MDSHDGRSTGGRDILWILPAFLLAVMLLIVTAVVLFLWLVVPVATLSGIEKTATDFATDAQRIAFVQKYSPVTIPDGATAFSIEFEHFQDTYLKATFRLPEQELDELAAALQKASPSAGLRFVLPGPLSLDDQSTFKLDRDRLQVELVYIDP